MGQWSGEEGAGNGGRGGGGREILGRGLYQNLLFYRFYSIFMYFNAITGYQKYIIDV